MRKLRVLLAEGEGRSSLAVVRALAAQGHTVLTAARSRLAQSLHSRFSAGKVVHPPYSPDSRVVRDRFLRVIAEEKIDVFFPAHIHSTWLAAQHAADFAPRVHVAVPELPVLEQVTDKWELDRTARHLGIPMPRTFCPASPAELGAALDQLEFPAVLKMRRGFGALGMRYLHSRAEAEGLYRSHPEFLVPTAGSGGTTGDYAFHDSTRPILQERVAGETHDASLLFCRGTLCAAMTQHRVMMYPYQGGRGIVTETTWEPELIELASALLTPLGWHGLVQVEFKISPDRRRRVIVDVNPRVWGSMDLAVLSGIDFPNLTCAVALGEAPRLINRYAVGLRYRMGFPYEWAAALQSPRPMRRLAACLCPEKGTLSPFRLRDPRPHVAELLYLLMTWRDRIPIRMAPRQP